jgi:DNA-binding HxlR family transcriptional regulator
MGSAIARWFGEVLPRVAYSLTDHGKRLNEGASPLGRARGKERIKRLADEGTLASI